MKAQFILGDVLAQVSTLPSNSFDAMLVDPPYGLGKAQHVEKALQAWLNGEDARINQTDFMGKDWTLPSPTVWREVKRTLKPGAFALVFAGARTQDLMGMSLRLAGFELRDTLMWLYADKRPPGTDVSRALDKARGVARHPGGVPVTEEAQMWEGYHSALKPSYEPILLARKPSGTTFVRCALEEGCGVLNMNQRGDGGRFPANTILDEDTAAVLDAQSGALKSGAEPEGGLVRRGDQNRHVYGSFSGHTAPGATYGDEGGASRFFYCARVSRTERQTGGVRRSTHVSLKPLNLTKHLATLLGLPERDAPRRLLVPYCGEASEIIGAGLSRYWDEVVGIEQDEAHLLRGGERLEWWLSRMKQSGTTDPVTLLSKVEKR